MKNEKTFSQLLDEAFEATRQAWNAQPERRDELSEQLNAIRERQIWDAHTEETETDNDEPTEGSFRNA